MRRESRPVVGATEPASISTAIKTGSSVRLDALDHFAMRLLSDALAEGTRGYWLRRAETFEAARPRVGDFTGRATRAELSAQWQRLTAIANACRARAQVAPLRELDPDVVNVWREGAA